ncbi:MAG: hypothetical protein Q8P37_01105 [Candidatus Spechtbacteria bacterium]|nr:hypothetical protein [Candidatus Spechtbacteria bacterium]
MADEHRSGLEQWFENLIPHIRDFFAENGYPLGADRDVSIEFEPHEIPPNRKGYKTCATTSSCLCPDSEYLNHGEVVVYLANMDNTPELVESIFHELDHVLWVFQGNNLEEEQVPWFRPSELRARSVARYWLKKLTRTGGITDVPINEIICRGHDHDKAGE